MAGSLWLIAVSRILGRNHAVVVGGAGGVDVSEVIHGVFKPQRARRTFTKATKILQLCKSQNHALDAVFHQPDIPVEQKAEMQAAQFEIRQQLGFVDRQEMLNGFVLHEHTAINARINPVA
jgi:hypothetical protein